MAKYLYKDKNGNVYDGWLKHLLKIRSPSLTMYYGYMYAGKFTRDEAKNVLSAICKD